MSNNLRHKCTLPFYKKERMQEEEDGEEHVYLRGWAVVIRDEDVKFPCHFNASKSRGKVPSEFTI